MRIVCIVQARMGSTRLPGKVMMPIAGTPMLGHVMRKVARLNVDDFVVATTDHPGDTVIEDWCKEKKYTYFRGPGDDVLQRYLLVAHYYEADAIVRITADCPLLDPCTSNRVIDIFRQASQVDHHNFEYVSNIYPERTFPRGWDTEIFTYGALLVATQGVTSFSDREHVTPWIQRHSKMWCVKNFEDQSRINFSVDTQEDLDRVRKILE